MKHYNKIFAEVIEFDVMYSRIDTITYSEKINDDEYFEGGDEGDMETEG